MVMKSMELDDDRKLDRMTISPMLKPDFPPGLVICLTEKEFETLELDPSVAVREAIVHGHFMGRITSVSFPPDPTKDNTCRVEIQIEDLEIECEDEENEQSEEEE